MKYYEQLSLECEISVFPTLYQSDETIIMSSIWYYIIYAVCKLSLSKETNKMPCVRFEVLKAVSTGVLISP